MARDVRLIRSPISVLGMVLTTISAVTFLIVFLADLFGLHTNPYVGIVFFLVLPAIFLLGLLLIPLGAWVERRRRRAGKPAAELHWPRLDLQDPHQRQTAVAIFALSMANIVLVSLAAYRGVEYMDSVPFCGQVCHQVMKPEFTAYHDAPHARVKCVDCHTGPGASSFVRAKVSGVRRVVAVASNNYPRPIPTPVHDMRPARETCEQCHWPEKFHGDVIRRIPEYADDEQNTETLTTLQVHVGGGNERLGLATGIHWHMNVANEVEYLATDDKRQVIPYVRLKDRDGNVREYLAKGMTADQLPAGERRRMDCMDCHNRPAHTMSPTAERAVDAAIARGEIPRSLPFVRREAVKAVKAAYPTHDAGMASIAQAFRDFYRTSHAAIAASKGREIEQAAASLEQIYRRNVFPEMNVSFGTYANNLGHVDFPGCFRCHDDEHTTKDGRKIGQDCELCHQIE